MPQYKRYRILGQIEAKGRYLYMENYTHELRQGRGNRFVPNQDPEGKENFPRHVFVDIDGSIQEVIRLNVLDDRHREEIVAFHFCRQFAELRYGDQNEQPQFYVIGRDCPWDFEYVLHDASNFFLEICRLGDEAFLKCIKAENDSMLILQKDKAPGFELLKVERAFPGTIPPDILAQIVTKVDKRRIFPIPDESRQPKLFLRPPLNPRINLSEAIQLAIQKKTNKKHKGKHETILVLDNLTTHSEPDDFFDALDKISGFIDKTPFDSIWLYTGYYCNNYGEDCEYSLTPVKLNARDKKALTREMLNQKTHAEPE